MKHLFKNLFGVIHEFEVDPVEQYRFNLFMTWLWLGVMFFIPRLPTFKHDTAAMLIMEVSLWANFASHFTAVGSSLAGVIASHRENELHSTPLRGFLGLIWRKKIRAARFSNPNYRPPTQANIVAVSTPPTPSESEALPGSKGLGWGDMDSAGMEALAADDFLL